MMDRHMSNELDNYITGHYGEDQFGNVEDCPECDGSGVCPECEGDTEDCTICDGDGNCPICGGSGLEE